MKRFAILASAVVAVALPIGAVANPGTNPSQNDSIGWCVSHGNYWSNEYSTPSTGESRSALAQTEPRAVADLIASARDMSVCTDQATEWVAPGQAGK